jgi:hypothetical protein
MLRCAGLAQLGRLWMLWSCGFVVGWCTSTIWLVDWSKGIDSPHSRGTSTHSCCWLVFQEANTHRRVGTNVPTANWAQLALFCWHDTQLSAFRANIMVNTERSSRCFNSMRSGPLILHFKSPRLGHKLRVLRQGNEATLICSPASTAYITLSITTTGDVQANDNRWPYSVCDLRLLSGNSPLQWDSHPHRQQ